MIEDNRIFVDKRGTDSARVKNDLELKILKGNYGESGQIPTIKKISEDYGIGFTTASALVRSLADENIVHSLQGKGCYVAPYCRPILIKKHTERLHRKMEELYEYATTLNVNFVELASKIAESKTSEKRSDDINK